MKIPWYTQNVLEMQHLDYLNQQRWACHLILMDGLARRIEELPPSEQPPDRLPKTLSGWATHPWLQKHSPSRLRQDIARVIHTLLPPCVRSARNGALFAVTYPLFAHVHHPSLIWWDDPRHPTVRQVSFLKTTIPPPLTLLIAQTGFPHAIIAALCLGTMAPITEPAGDMRPEWWLFFNHQFLEWKRRARRLTGLIPEAERHGIDPAALRRLANPDQSPIADDKREIELILWELDHGLPPPDAIRECPAWTYQVDWFERSWHPDSRYRRRRAPYLAAALQKPSPHVTLHALNRAWQCAPHIAQAIGMLIEQTLVLKRFASITELFVRHAPHNQLDLAFIPEALTVWDAAYGSLPPPP
jgi:hypothetical protein